MINSNLKKTLYIPIEIKAREFYSSLLLAAECSKLGFRVYIGDKEGVFWLLKNKIKKSGIFFYKSQLRDYEKVVSIKCEKIAILDQEIGLANNNLIESYTARFPKNPSYDKYFLIGRKHEEIVGKMFPDSVNKLCVSGWPKFDLYNKKFLKIFENKKKSFNQNYILIASDFGYNSKKRVEEAFARLDKSGMSDSDKQTMQRRVIRQYNSCRALIDEMTNIQIFNHDAKVFFRPHPAEDHDQWVKDFGEIKGIECVYEGDIGDWILGAKLFIHRGSTTAIQSYMMGVPTIAMDSYYDDDRKNLLSYRVSWKADNLNTILLDHQRFLIGVGAAGVDIENISSEILIDDELASTKIARELDSMLVGLEDYQKVNLLSRLFYHFKKNLAHIIFKQLHGKFGKGYKKEEKIQSGFSAGEAAQFYEDYKFENLHVRNVAHNLIEIESRV